MFQIDVYKRQLSTGLFENAWFASGTPTFLADMLRKTDFDLRDLDGIEVSSASLSDDRADIHNPVPMIYQSGYLTIKKYDSQFGLYTLCLLYTSPVFRLCR